MSIAYREEIEKERRKDRWAIATHKPQTIFSFSFTFVHRYSPQKKKSHNKISNERAALCFVARIESVVEKSRNDRVEEVNRVGVFFDFVVFCLKCFVINSYEKYYYILFRVSCKCP